MKRNSIKIERIEISWSGAAVVGAARAVFATRSLMTLRSVALEAVDHTCLGRAQRDPVLHFPLQTNEELLRQPLGFVVHVSAPSELELIGKLADQWCVVAAIAPQRYVTVPLDTFPEVEVAKFKQHLFHDGLVDQLHLFIFRLLQHSQSREDMCQLPHAELVALVHLAQAELTIVGVENPEAADALLQRKCFGFELDLVFARDVGTYIDLRGGHLVGVPELEDDLRIAYGKAVDVSDAPPKDESIVIKTKIRSVHKDDFTNVGAAADLGIRDETDFKLPRAVLHQFAEVTKAFYRGEALRLQDDLGLHVLHGVQRMTICIRAGRLDLFTHPAVVHSTGLANDGAFTILFFLVFLLVPLVVLRHAHAPFCFRRPRC